MKTHSWEFGDIQFLKTERKKLFNKKKFIFNTEQCHKIQMIKEEKEKQFKIKL